MWLDPSLMFNSRVPQASAKFFAVFQTYVYRPVAGSYDSPDLEDATTVSIGSVAPLVQDVTVKVGAPFVLTRATSADAE